MPQDHSIKFGTDGWRGIIADDFTFDNVRRVAGAIAAYVLKHEESKRGVFIGYDTRLLSQQAAQACCGSDRRGRNSRQTGQRLHADAGCFLCGETPGRRGWSHDHLQPQSVELEWGEVQRQVWRLGHACHHASESKRKWPPGQCPAAENAGNRRSRFEAAYVDGGLRFRRPRSDRQAEFQVCRRCDVRLRHAVFCRGYSVGGESGTWPFAKR